MRESRTYGSVRGALSNERPYRDCNETRGKPCGQFPDFALLNPASAAKLAAIPAGASPANRGVQSLL